jgi:hypothetical protein
MARPGRRRHQRPADHRLLSGGQGQDGGDTLLEDGWC